MLPLALPALSSLTGGGALAAPSNATSGANSSAQLSGGNVGGAVFGPMLFPGATNSGSVAGAASSPSSSIDWKMAAVAVAGAALLIMLWRRA